MDCYLLHLFKKQAGYYKFLFYEFFIVQEKVIYLHLPRSQVNIASDHFEVIKYLANSENIDRFLLAAAESHDFRIVKYLVNQGANVSIIDDQLLIHLSETDKDLVNYILKEQKERSEKKVISPKMIDLDSILHYYATSSMTEHFTEEDQKCLATDDDVGIISQALNLNSIIDLTKHNVYDIDDITSVDMKKGAISGFIFNTKKDIILAYDVPFLIQALHQSKSRLAFSFASIIKENESHRLLVVFDTKTKSCYLVDSNGPSDNEIFDKIEQFLALYCFQIDYQYVYQSKWFSPKFVINPKFEQFISGHCVGLSYLIAYLMQIANKDPMTFINQWVKHEQYLKGDNLINIIKTFSVVLNERMIEYFNKLSIRK